MLPAIIPGDASLTTGEWFGVVLRVAGGIALAAVFYPLMSSLIPAMICVAMAGGLWLGAGKYASIVEAPIATTIHPWTLAIGVVACFAVSLMIALLITLASGVVGRLRGELSWNWERHSRTQRFIGVFLNVVVAGYLPYLWYVTTLKS
jgi:hypothetical protein